MLKKRGITVEQAERVRLKRGIGYGTKLRVMRVKRGLSQSELSAASGVGIKSIQSFEQRVNNVERTNLYTLCGLCEALGCKIPDIIDDTALVERFNKTK